MLHNLINERLTLVQVTWANVEHIYAYAITRAQLTATFVFTCVYSHRWLNMELL